jgi:hypothetical protein
MSYTLVALPENNALKELQSIRNFLYTHNFRYNNKPVSDKAHISLSVIDNNIPECFMPDLVKDFK